MTTSIFRRSLVFVFPLVIGCGFLHPNDPPQAHAGSDYATRTGKAIVLDGSGSTDPNQNVLTYLWTIMAKPDLSILTDEDIEHTSDSQATVVLDASGDYVFGLTVSDGTEQSVDEVVITAVELGIYDMCTDMWSWNDDTITEGIGLLASSGFNAALVPMAGGDTLLYDSDHVETKAWFPADKFPAAINGLHSNGIKAYAWFSLIHNYWIGNEVDAGLEWRGVCSDGKYDIDYWDQENNPWGRYFYDVIPPSILLSHQECLDLYKNIFEELITEMGFDGIDVNDNFQFLNHWDPVAQRTVWASYDFITMQKFVSETDADLPGIDLASREVYDPVDAAAYIEGSPTLRESFFSWRADQATALLKAFQDMADEIAPDIPIRPHLMPGYTSRDDWGYNRPGIAAAVDVCFLMLGEDRESIETAIGWYVDAGAKHIDARFSVMDITKQDVETDYQASLDKLVDRITWALEAGADSITLYNFGHIYANELWDLVKNAWHTIWD